MYVCMHLCTYVCIYICMYVSMYVYMYVCMYACAKRGTRGLQNGPKGPPWELEGWAHSAQIF